MNDSFVFYRSWLQIINEEYEDEETKKSLVFSIVLYGISGKKTFPCEKMFLKQCFAQIDSAKKKHDIAVENGRKGGAPRGNSNAKKTTKNNQKQPKVDLKQPNENVNAHVNENGHEHDNDNVTTSDSGIPLTEARTEEKEELTEEEMVEMYGDPV